MLFLEKQFLQFIAFWNQKKKKVHFSIWGWYMCISKHQPFHHLVSRSSKWDYLMFNLTKPKVNLTTQDLIVKILLNHKKEHQSSHLYLILVHQKLEIFFNNSIFGYLKGWKSNRQIDPQPFNCPIKRSNKLWFKSLMCYCKVIFKGYNFSFFKSQIGIEIRKLKACKMARFVTWQFWHSHFHLEFLFKCYVHMNKFLIQN